MRELADIVAAWEAVRGAGGEAVLATVVGVSGSTYRRPGARMLLTSEGRAAGSVSGGCLETDLHKKSWWRTQCGAALVTYDSTDEEDIVWGYGLGCNGIVRVLLERVSADAPGPLDLLRAVLCERRPGLVATVVGGQGATCIGERLLLMPNGEAVSNVISQSLSSQVEADARAALSQEASRAASYILPNGDMAQVFLETILPPMPLVIFGSNHDAAPLVRLAKELGWHVTVVDARGAQARPERFPGADSVLAGAPETLIELLTLDARTAAVVMTHHYPDDRRVLRLLLQSPIGYIGQLGPRARTERLLGEIRDAGLPITEDQRRRLHGPAGLDIGADAPEEIALAIVSEIQAVRAGGAGGRLRDRRAPLHSEVPACRQ